MGIHQQAVNKYDGRRKFQRPIKCWAIAEDTHRAANAIEVAMKNAVYLAIVFALTLAGSADTVVSGSVRR